MKTDLQSCIEKVCECWDQKLFRRTQQLSTVFEDQPADVFIAAQVQWFKSLLLSTLHEEH